MRQVIVLPHWNDPVAGIWQDHPTQSHYQLTPGRPAIFPSTHLSMPSVSKGATCTIFLRLLVCRGWGSNPQPSVPQANALPLHHLGRLTKIVWQTNMRLAIELCVIRDSDIFWNYYVTLRYTCTCKLAPLESIQPYPPKPLNRGLFPSIHSL